MKKILVVDDERTITMLVKGSLSIQGYSVASATSPQQALDLMSEESFDLMISDYMMPSINGLELCRLARGKKPEIKLIILSAKKMDVGETIELNALGAAIVPKPFSALQLKDEIEKVLK